MTDEATFQASLRQGKLGERYALEILRTNPHIKNVIDARDDWNCQNDDIDFIVEAKNHKGSKSVYYIEVKTDFQAHVSGNVAYETKTGLNEGCFAKTKADYVYYYLPYLDEMYSINVARLRRFVKANNLQEVDMGDVARGYLLPIKVLVANDIMKRIND